MSGTSDGATSVISFRLGVAEQPVTYLERLTARVEEVGNCLCVGLDPEPGSLPAGFSADVAGIERFGGLIIDAALERAAAIKANVAFFEAFGSAGLGVLERLRTRIPASIPFIADAKRGDIGSTAARQVVALFDMIGADAVTLNPYLGRDALAPFLDRDDRFVYVLCRTSNPAAASDPKPGSERRTAPRSRRAPRPRVGGRGRKRRTGCGRNGPGRACPHS